MARDLELFHCDGEPYTVLEIRGHREVWALKSKAFRQWLARRFHETAGKVPNSQATQDALNILGGKAMFDGPERPVFTRCARHDGRIYLDLCNESWEAVQIDTAGWRIVNDPPVMFKRARAMEPLPRPLVGGGAEELREFVNVTPADWPLYLAYLIQAFEPSGPYPVLVLNGEHGTAKSTTARIARALIDPNGAPLRAEPREARDLMIAANNSWVIALDNLSHVPAWLSDALCRLSTGGGFATRQLYSDTEETIFEAKRPVILNGIEELATRGDLLDRSIVACLPTISDSERRSEEDFWQTFFAARPRILGGLLDAVVCAMQNIADVELDQLPRIRWPCDRRPADDSPDPRQDLDPPKG